MTEGREPGQDEGPPRSPILSATPSSLEPPPSDQPRTVRPLRIGGVLGRTFDTFVAHPLEFAALALPSAALALALYAFRPSGASAGTSGLLSLVSLIVGILFSLATIIAADDVQVGRPIDLASEIRRAAGRTVPGVLSGFAFLCAFVLLFTVVIVIAIVLALIGSTAIVTAGLILAFLGIAYLTLRWILSLPAIALDDVGPIEAIRLSWRITRGNVLRLVGLFVLLGLLLLPLTVGLTFISLAGESDTVAALVSLAATLVTGPIGAIALAVSYSDLSGRATVPTALKPNPTGRWILAVLIVGIGISGIVIGGPRIGPAIERLREQMTPPSLTMHETRGGNPGSATRIRLG